MIYIYNDYGGTHTTVLAASYHLKKLTEERVPTDSEVLNLPNFNKLVSRDRGKLYYHGTDDEGNRVYTIARGPSKLLVPGMVNMLAMLIDEHKLEDKIILSNTSPTVPLPMTIGGFLSRGLKMNTIGVPLILMGVKQTYQNIIDLVHHTKSAAKSASTQVVVLDNPGMRSKARLF
ncbi:DUF3189 family protein [Paenibacillus tarimensis]|uniref:DUF3189 family protein n=1 Tax=Paenibacillus tarimensis TaxID=416012 RepID=UPI001F219999|nr:DUF3189 family protein [Paenibacillus tarimensis]MCF2945541.1 DUF3189 family protein [Paenibacillus tarimensis]